jgi:hypothetical protein
LFLLIFSTNFIGWFVFDLGLINSISSCIGRSKESIKYTTKDTNSIAKVEIPELVTELNVADLNKMLPIKLYFHNDEPDSNVTVSYTFKPYSEPYNYYISLQKTYSEEYASQFSSQNKIEAEKKVNDFFYLE